jgi:2-methylisocitrate lyase-like PEP mutase family enzyme
VAKLVAEIGFDGVYTELPALIDADTGFGEPMNAARTVTMLEDSCPTSTSRPVPLIT